VWAQAQSRLASSPRDRARHLRRRAGRPVAGGRAERHHAFVDLFGPQYLELAVELGVAPERINTITSPAEATELGAKAEGSATASTVRVLGEMMALVASGQIELPIAASYPLERVRDAFAELEERHTHGKIVLIP
jgi:NADPH:quinone reductase-like Zn-dependent oxidoreductase